MVFASVLVAACATDGSQASSGPDAEGMRASENIEASVSEEDGVGMTVTRWRRHDSDVEACREQARCTHEL